MTNSEYQQTYSNMTSLTGTPNPESDSDGAKQVHDQRIVIPNKLITEAECINRKDQAWFITTQIPTDLKIKVQEITFHVHKVTTSMQISSNFGSIIH
ncbi:hypothetical protein IC582_016325 [Cucumis melo]